MNAGTLTTVGLMRPPRPVRSACECAGSSSPAPPGCFSGEVLVCVPLPPEGTVTVSLRSVSVAVLGAGWVWGAVVWPLLSSSPPQPATTPSTRTATQRRAKAGLKRLPSYSERACEERHDAQRPWTHGNRLVGFDLERRRIWIAG